MIEDDIQTLQENQKLLVEQTQMYLQKLLPDEIVCLMQKEQYYFLVNKELKIYERVYDKAYPQLYRERGLTIMDGTDDNENALNDNKYKIVWSVERDCGDWPRQKATTPEEYIQDFNEQFNKTEG